ncbi:MAG: hypothetical protein JWO67_4177 [Streptosporangiaceae bacterium]|nr:hypothetical protein [Streptosporangiaceae bacterium]
MTFPYGVPIVLVKRSKSGTDSFGNDVFAVTTSTVLGAFAPGGSTEQVQGQDTVTTQPTVFLPVGTNLAAVDAVQVAGLTFEVDGDPNTWISPLTGNGFGLEVKLRRVTG